MERSELENRRRQLEMSLANENQLTPDAGLRIIKKLLALCDEELGGLGDD